MNRYLQSFLIASIVYSSLFASMFIEFDSQKEITQGQKYQEIQMQHYKITPPKPPKEPKIKKPQPLQKPQIPKPKPPQKKQEKNPQPVKEKEIKAPKQLQKPAKEPVENEPANEEPVEEKEKLQKPQEKERLQPEVPLLKKLQKAYSKADKDAFLSYIRSSIEKNKTYPRAAQRRAIEGAVDVSFTITANGTLKQLHTKASHKYFEKSTQKAIEKIFPVTYGLEKVKLPMELNLVVEYKLR